MRDLIHFYFIWLDVGIGGWLIMLVVGAGLAWWLIENSQARHLPDGTVWRLMVLAPFAFFAPTVLCGASTALNPTVSLNDPKILNRPEYMITALLGCLFVGTIAAICIIYMVWFWGQEGTLDQNFLYNPSREMNPITRIQIEELRKAGVKISPEQVELSRLQTGELANVALISVDKTEAYRLREGINRIGRRRQNHIFLSDRSISRDHAFIWCNQKHCTIYARNDKILLVNNQRISNKTLTPNDIVRFGLSPKMYRIEYLDGGRL